MNPINILRGQNAKFSTVIAGGAYSSHTTSMWKTAFSKIAMKCCFSVGYIVMICNRNSLDISVGTTMGYEMDSRCSIPGTDKIVLLFTTPSPDLVPSQPPIERVLEAISPAVKR
jgi:hypothetical protein